MTAPRERHGRPDPSGPAGVDPDDRWYSSSKNLTDLLLSAILLVWALPLLLIAMVAVAATSRGPIIYTQERVGRRGRRFTIYKIRSMYADSERATGPTWSSGRDDRRVTPVGRFLRVSHLDELPQLWNVIRGDMSLVGPRPERPFFVESLVQQVPRYEERHAVRPGVTGLAQLQLPPDTEVDCVRNKLEFDLQYIAERSAWLDLRIMAATFVAMFGIPFGVTGRLFNIPSPRPSPREGHPAPVMAVAEPPPLAALPQPQSV